MTSASRAEASTEPRTHHELRVAWVSASYGFGADLAYYRQVLAEFVGRFPRTVVHVVERFPVQRYAELPLRADFAFRIWRRSTTVSGVSYTGDISLPTPGTALRLLRDPADVFIVIEFTPVALLGFLLARLRRRRVALLVEGDPSFRGAPRKPWVHAIKRTVARRCDAILTSNRLGLRYLTDDLGVDPANVLVGPYLTSDPGVQHDGRSRPQEQVRLLFLNTVSARKGILQLVEALARQPATLAGRWRLDVVGSGDAEPAVRDLVARHGLDAAVTFHGRVAHSEVGRFYAGSDVVVCPTLADYRSLAGIEAVNAGKPVVVSSLDGAAQEIEEYAPSAWVVDPKDVPAFAATLSEILGDPDRLRADLERSRTPPEHFSLRVVGDNLERVVERAAR